MTRIRQWLIAVLTAVLLTLSVSAIASADPGDPGAGLWGSSGDSSPTYFDPGDPGGGW